MRETALAKSLVVIKIQGESNIREGGCLGLLVQGDTVRHGSKSTRVLATVPLLSESRDGHWRSAPVLPVPQTI